MSLEQARVIFGKLRDAGTLSILLTGGEIFTHKQFKAIISRPSSMASSSR